MANKDARSVMHFVFKQFVTTEHYREGRHSGIRASFNMDEADVRTVLDFIAEKESATPEQAQTAQDVCAVIRITEGEKVVGSYERQGKAYQRYLIIELVDMRSGEVVASQNIYGGRPPSSINVKSGERNRSAYGSRLAEEDIALAVQSLIDLYETGK